MATRRYKRRRILIDRRQIDLLGVTLLYFVATALVFAATMFGPLVVELAGGEPSLEQAAIASEFLSLHTRFWPALLATFALLSVHSIFTSHRIVGPLYRFRTVFKEVQEGNLVPWIGLRRRDLLIREATALNDMVTSLRERVSRLSAQQERAHRELASVERSLQTNSVREARVHMVELDEALTTLGEQLDGFRLRQEKG
jgi:nitrogen fixation/metabolism regulation signal transduction histidine kinase